MQYAIVGSHKDTFLQAKAVLAILNVYALGLTDSVLGFRKISRSDHRIGNERTFRFRPFTGLVPDRKPVAHGSQSYGAAIEHVV